VARTPNSLRARLTLAAAGLGIALVIAELGLRWMAPLGPEFILDGTTSFYDPSLFQEDPVLLTRLAPNARATIQTVEGTTEVRTNSLGLRGPDLGPKTAGGLRVLALGDSFTLGLQVDGSATWPAHLSSDLSAHLGQVVEVLNAGVSGFGTEQSTIRMRELAEVTGADAAVLMIYLGNDLRDNARYRERREAQGHLPEIPPEVPPPPVLRHYLRDLARWSRLAAYGVMWSQTAAASTDPALQEYRDEILPFVDSARLQALMPATGRALQGFASTCAQLRLSCIVALAPPAYGVHTERLPRTLSAFGLEDRTPALDAPAAAITASVPAGIPVIDLTPALRDARETALYLTFDPHWSAAGHAVAAAALTAPVARALRARSHAP
jgi:lysophospholipase L1-like esterase